MSSKCKLRTAMDCKQCSWHNEPAGLTSLQLSRRGISGSLRSFLSRTLSRLSFSLETSQTRCASEVCYAYGIHGVLLQIVSQLRTTIESYIHAPDCGSVEIKKSVPKARALILPRGEHYAFRFLYFDIHGGIREAIHPVRAAEGALRVFDGPYVPQVRATRNGASAAVIQHRPPPHQTSGKIFNRRGCISSSHARPLSHPRRYYIV